MASSSDFAEYVCGQIAEAGVITCKKMFGEYGVYCNGKIIGLICDNQFFIKKTKSLPEIYPDLKSAPPYEGAKDYYVADCVDDSSLTSRLVAAAYDDLPAPGPKKKKKPSSSEK